LKISSNATIPKTATAAMKPGVRNPQKAGSGNSATMKS